ncbi:MAG TPA: diaminopimelate decarboxylase [Vicinamibacterales bacterium]|nr:diaminopimelate decarboxylase [Vicinamibacterales bacterium]
MIGFSRTAEELTCDGVSLSAIAAAEGTPLYVYSAAMLRHRYRDLDAAFGDYPHAIHYAFKANSTRALVAELRALGSAVDAVSMWEVDVARRVGFEPRQIVFDGVGKSDAELESAVALDLKAINVESIGELQRVEAIAARTGSVARVAIRVNPDIDAKSHPHISTGLKINKFGIPTSDVQTLLPTFGERRAVQLVALHVHVGSQITSMDPIRHAALRLAELAHDAQQARVTLEYLDAGGGLGISYDGGPVPTFRDYATAFVDAIRTTRLPIVVEPGRSIIGPAGALLARVLDLKPRTATSEFAVIDAGMSELMRPALYNAFHLIEPINAKLGGLRQYEVVGPVCESGDVVGRDRMLTPLGVGDLVAVCDAGAYGAVMASNYNRRPLPAEVLVDNGTWRVIRRRQTLADLLALET